MMSHFLFFLVVSFVVLRRSDHGEPDPHGEDPHGEPEKPGEPKKPDDEPHDEPHDPNAYHPVL